MANYTKTDLIRDIRNHVPLSMGVMDQIVSAIFRTIKDETEAGKTVNITGFGRFAMKDRPARQGRNPGTGAPIQIAASRVLAFKPAKSST